ncbi:hypothetical protein L6452_42194 [Arctium lappa]|uniref:Uncharacterized protein n=1 Tax=Arctium lappa TaxID=4217 RepID=A0ACB8XIQ7_ARCLA|nr:hypothetical protein L6452_42194 [Arctium lappa]
MGKKEVRYTLGESVRESDIGHNRGAESLARVCPRYILGESVLARVPWAQLSSASSRFVGELGASEGIQDLILETQALWVLDGSEWRVKLGRSSGRMALVASSGFEKIADLVVLVTLARLCSCMRNLIVPFKP